MSTKTRSKATFTTKGLKASHKEKLAAHPEGREPKILVFDIETAPSLAYIWRCYKENVSPAQLQEHSTVMCWAAKWLDDDHVFFESAEGDKDDTKVCAGLWRLMDEANMVVAHNGRAFDTKKMRTRWIQQGFQPPAPYKVGDTLDFCKKEFAFEMNKLDYVARYLKHGRKLDHEGFRLWTRCMAGDDTAWQTMGEYNIHDAKMLEGVYLDLRPWATSHPNVGLMYGDGKRRCVVCGSEKIKRLDQSAYTMVSEFESFRCKNCGKIMRNGKRVRGSVETMRHVN